MAKTAFKGTPVTLAGEFVKAGTSAPEFTLVKGDLSNYTLKACAHGPGTDLPYRLCLFLSPLLTSEYDKSVSQSHKQLLKDELYLVYGSHTG